MTPISKTTGNANNSAKLSYNALIEAKNEIANSQFKIATGKRINQASDNVSGYITSRLLSSRTSTLSSALKINSEANAVANIAQDAYDSVYNDVKKIRETAITASSGSLGTDEKIALAKSATQLIKQIDNTVNSTVYSGKNLIDGQFNESQLSGLDANNQVLTNSIDLSSDKDNFSLNTLDQKREIENNTNNQVFAGVEDLNLNDFNNVSSSDLGIFSDDKIATTIQSLSNALENISNVNAKVGGVSQQIDSQNDSLISQITNQKASISRIEDTDIAQETSSLVRSSFLSDASLSSLSQANASSQAFLSLL